MIRHEDGSVTVTYKFEVTRGRKGRKQLSPATVPQEEAAPPAPLRPVIDPTTVPRITRMLVLGYHFERLVREGKFKNYAEIARLTGLSRARVTHLADLCLLSPRIQGALFVASGSARPPTERRARTLTHRTIWTEQESALSRLQRTAAPPSSLHPRSD